MELRGYTQEDIHNKRVLMRCDLDVGVNSKGAVDEYHDLRLERVVPTLMELFSFGAKQVVLIGHRGRPKGALEPGLSLAPVCDRLAELCRAEGLDEPISFVEDIEADPLSHCDQDVVMLENLRFWPGEKDCDAGFARSLARWGEVYVNDAFGASHRHDASVTLLASLLGAAFAGRGLAAEVRQLENFFAGKRKPFVAVVGGAKISTKLPLLKILSLQADSVLVGGALANTILASQGIGMGTSLVEESMLNKARELSGSAFVLPEDAVLASGAIVPVDGISAKDAMLDIGPQTIKKFVQRIQEANTILWNGPLGAFEDKAFSAGSEQIGRAIAENTRASSLAGGGETVELVERLGLGRGIDFVSTGGGAMLTFMAGGDMPGLDALRVYQ